MSQFECIRFEIDGAIARIRLHRPDAANGLDSRMAAELKAAAKACSDDPRIKVVLLGAEGRFFCAGGDLREMLSHGDAIGEAAQALADDFHAAMSLLANMQADFALNFGIDRDVYAGVMMALLLQPFVKRIIE